jgi:hypothetical protein
MPSRKYRTDRENEKLKNEQAGDRRKIRARDLKTGEEENQNVSANLKNMQGTEIPWRRQTQVETQ